MNSFWNIRKSENFVITLGTYNIVLLSTTLKKWSEKETIILRVS